MATLSLVALTDGPPLQSFEPYADEWWFHHVELAVINGELDFVDKEDMDARCPEASNLNRALVLFFDHLADEWKKPPSQFFCRASDTQECARIRSGRILLLYDQQIAVPLYQLLPPLHMAAELGLASHVERLLARDSNVDVTGHIDALPVPLGTTIMDRRQSSPFPTSELPFITSLFWTVARTSREAQLRTIDILLDRGAARMSDAAREYGSLMHLTRFAPKDVIIGQLIARGVDIDARGYQGLTALHTAAAWRDDEWLRTLLAHGANPDALDAIGKTPLMRACSSGYGLSTEVADTVRALVEAGADVDLHGPGALTALQWAAVGHAREARDLLLRAGANAEGLSELKELGVGEGASQVIRGRLWDLEEKRRLRYAEGLPPLSLSAQRELLRPPPELVGLPYPYSLYWEKTDELERDDPDLVRYWGPN